MNQFCLGVKEKIYYTGNRRDKWRMVTYKYNGFLNKFKELWNQKLFKSNLLHFQ